MRLTRRRRPSFTPTPIRPWAGSAIYRQRVRDGLEDEPAEGAITTFEDAKTFLETFANKLVTEGVVATLNELLGLASFEEESEDPDPEE